MNVKLLLLRLVLLLGVRTGATDATPPAVDPAPERWNLYYQATSIGQYHGSFPSPYQGPLSLEPHPEAEWPKSTAASSRMGTKAPSAP